MPLNIADKEYKNAKNMKIIKLALFLCPTQLFINGQWWSNPSTHLLQVLQ